MPKVKALEAFTAYHRDTPVTAEAGEEFDGDTAAWMLAVSLPVEVVEPDPDSEGAAPRRRSRKS